MFDFDLRGIVQMIIPVLLALTVHEYAHALAAYRLGDPTAKNEGRLTLNPLAHLDPIGTLMLFFSRIIGWAKPVPFNPSYFKNPTRDITLVALAGPLSNFILAVVLTLLFKVLLWVGFFQNFSGLGEDLIHIFSLAIIINISLAVFNLLPIPPLDGFKVVSYFLPHRWVVAAYQFQMVIMVLFIILVVTGLLPAIIRPVVVGLFKFLMV